MGTAFSPVYYDQEQPVPWSRGSTTSVDTDASILWYCSVHGGYPVQGGVSSSFILTGIRGGVRIQQASAG